jgi:CHASE3 domain sensor protein
MTDYEYLVEDPVIPNQQFTVVSFAEPKNTPLLERKETLYAHEFLTSYLLDRQKAIELKEKEGKVPLELRKYLEKEPKLETIDELYKSFKQTHLEQLNKKFNKIDNQKNELIDTAFKVRGTFDTMERAQKRAEEMKNAVNGFHICL